ncbi:O-antigen polymerase [Paramixta manurensis]|uniref:O-antigen polymerase n=1 Tax=Paramixta manurensis TaxID=2740817 RepID=A0A6M8UH87_9GAMM|nr:O-antigen polymerase [Erwiniaceae bacterium PD-1]
MNDLDNIKTIKLSLAVIFSIGVLLVLFFPLGAYLFSFLVLAFIANAKNGEYKKLLFFAFIIILISTFIINENSVQKFIFREDDFTTYYNNYLDLLNGHYIALFNFGGGFEIGLPGLNFLLSVIINQPLPYVIQIFYILLFMAMLYYLVKIDTLFIVSRKENKYMLFLWGALFLKITAMLTIERQAIASFFVLFALFDNRKRLFWLAIGCLFHLSTPVIYFVIRYLLQTRSFKRAILSSVALLGFVVFAYPILTIINNIFPNDKIGFVLFFMKNKDLINNEIIKSVKQIFYIFPLIVLDLLLRLKGIRWSLAPSLLLFVFGMLILSILPGVPTRIMMPIIFILFGFYYYNFFSLFSNRTHLYMFMLLAISLAIYKFFLPGYYYRYPLIESYPGYYVDAFMEKQDYIRRLSLPGIADVTIDNGNKL